MICDTQSIDILPDAKILQNIRTTSVWPNSSHRSQYPEVENFEGTARFITSLATSQEIENFESDVDFTTLRETYY